MKLFNIYVYYFSFCGFVLPDKNEHPKILWHCSRLTKRSMASAASIPSSSQPEPNIFSIKEFAKSNGDFSLIPSTYHSISQIHDDDDDVAENLASSIPVIDFSHLASHHPQTHAKAVHLLGEACAEWGVFMVRNSETFSF